MPAALAMPQRAAGRQRRISRVGRHHHPMSLNPMKPSTVRMYFDWKSQASAALPEGIRRRGRAPRDRPAGHKTPVSDSGEKLKVSRAGSAHPVMLQLIRDREVPHRGGQHVFVVGLEILGDSGNLPRQPFLPGVVQAVENRILGVQGEPVKGRQVNFEEVQARDGIRR